MLLPEPVDIGGQPAGAVGIFERNGQPLVIPQTLHAHGTQPNVAP